MNLLTKMVPDVDVLLALEPEELAPLVLRLAREAMQNDLIHPQAIVRQVDGSPHDSSDGYPQNRRAAAELALNEAWNWLKVNGIVIPDSGPNGNNGWHRLSRRGTRLLDDKDFRSFREAAAFPKGLLHSQIADEVWLDLARGDYETAVFRAFKTVEIAVRDASRLSANDIGVPLMRKAFDKEKGPLTNLAQPEGERDALSHLFAGAIGSYKNPHSHRAVSIDAKEAQEMVVLASHLLRIVDSRRA